MSVALTPRQVSATRASWQSDGVLVAEADLGSDRPGVAHKIRIAVLDMDGTLFRGSLATRMAEAVRTVPGHSGSAVGEALRAIDLYKTGHITHDECATLFYNAYVRAIRGLPTELLRQAAAVTWRHNRDQLFPHAFGLADLLREHGMLSCLISGCPEEVIRLAADDLGLDRWWGLTTATRAGVHTGDVLRAPGRRGGKKAVLTELSRDLDIDWSRSFAIGDSSADIEVLDMVGAPVAFEPDPQLWQVARRRGWTIANRDDALRHSRNLLSLTRPDPPRFVGVNGNRDSRSNVPLPRGYPGEAHVIAGRLRCRGLEAHHADNSASAGTAR